MRYHKLALEQQLAARQKRNAKQKTKHANATRHRVARAPPDLTRPLQAVFDVGRERVQQTLGHLLRLRIGRLAVTAAQPSGSHTRRTRHSATHVCVTPGTMTCVLPLVPSVPDSNSDCATVSHSHTAIEAHSHPMRIVSGPSQNTHHNISAIQSNRKGRIETRRLTFGKKCIWSRRKGGRECCPAHCRRRPDRTRTRR